MKRQDCQTAMTHEQLHAACKGYTLNQKTQKQSKLKKKHI